MKKYIITLALSMIITVSAFGGFGEASQIGLFDLSSDQSFATTKMSKAAESVKALIAGTEIATGSESSYNRDLYTSKYQYYKSKSGTKYKSIRAYSYYNTEWYNNKTTVYLDPYTNKDGLTLKKSDYDHIIPLHYANLHGADKWTEKQKKIYADDPTVGVCVNLSDNRAKSDKGPSEWLPKENQDDYCYTWLIIAEKYNLSLTKEDVAAIKKVLNNANMEELSLINEYRN